MTIAARGYSPDQYTYTTNILNEPIAENGLHPAFCIHLDDELHLRHLARNKPDEIVMGEALVPAADVEAHTASAARISKALGSELQVRVVIDKAPGRRDSGYRILEFTGFRIAVTEFKKQFNRLYRSTNH